MAIKKYTYYLIIKLFILMLCGSCYCVYSAELEKDSGMINWNNIHLPYENNIVQGFLFKSIFTVVTKDTKNKIQMLWLSKDLKLWRGFILPYGIPLWIAQQISEDQIIKIFNHEDYYWGIHIDKNGEITTDDSDFSF